MSSFLGSKLKDKEESQQAIRQLSSQQKDINWFETRGRECLEWAERVKSKNKEKAAITWYIRSYFFFVRGGNMRQGKKVMENAITSQKDENFLLAQCFLQLALAKLKLGENPTEVLNKGRKKLKQWSKKESQDPFLPPNRRYEGILSAFKIISLIWNSEIKKARREWEKKRKEILAAWNWYREEMKTLLTSLLQRISVKEAIQSFNEY